MSALIIAEITCDKCGAKIIGTRQTKPESYESYTIALLAARHFKWSVYKQDSVEKYFCCICSDGGTGDGSTFMAQDFVDEDAKRRREGLK